MFLDNFLIAAEQVAILYILVAVGFIADRTKLFTEKAARLCTDLMFYIITPAKIVQSFISMEFSRIGDAPCDSRCLRRRDTYYRRGGQLRCVQQIADRQSCNIQIFERLR